MPLEVLRFESSILHYGISSNNEEPYSGHVGQLLVREVYSSTTDQDLPSGVQNYQVIVEATVSTREEAWNAKFEAFEFAEELDRAWVYVCGRPLHPVYMQLEFRDSPIGWHTNAKEIEIKLAQAEARPYAIIGSVKDWHWIRLPFSPLREALKVRETLKIASEATVALADLYYSALKSPDGNGKLFLLAKALELCREIVPGKNDKALHRFLPENIRSALKSSIGELFKMSNFRFDIRHVVKKGSEELQLHPRLTTEERIAFTEDVDLVIRAIVCQQIDRPAFVVKQQ